MITPAFTLALVLNVVAPTSSAAAAPPESLVGLWATGLHHAQAIHGELRIVRHGSTGTATIAGQHVAFPITRDSIRFALPHGLGGFRGVRTNGGKAIEGFWLQPGGGTEDFRDPGGTSQPFASPLILRRAATGAWRGTVRPLEATFTLYLRIYRNARGTLVGAFRNPEMNANGGASIFRVTQEGNTVSFVSRPDTTRPGIRLAGMRVNSPDRIRILWPDLGSMIELARSTPSQVPNFFPRPLGDTTYVYRRPPDTGDGWETARAGAVGMDEPAMTRLVQRLVTADPTLPRPSLIHSLLVARHGKLVLDEYFFGFDRERQHDLRSAGKTFSSVLLGNRMMAGVGVTPETPVYDVLAGLGPFANPDPRKAQITLAQPMTHTSGLACDDNDEASPGNEDTMQRQTQQPNWWKYVLDLPVVHDPGSRYAYASGGMNLVGAVLTTATGTWLPALFERVIARPLRMGTYYWNLMPTGEGYLGGGVFMRPRDLLKIGQAYLDSGVWHGARIVDSAWVRVSTAPKAHVSPATTGITPDDFGNYYSEADDAYAWHLSQLHSGERTYRAFAASGNGGQLLIVVPEADLVVVFTAGNYGQGGIWGRWGDQIVGGEILPAIRE